MAGLLSLAIGGAVMQAEIGGAATGTATAATSAPKRAYYGTALMSGAVRHPSGLFSAYRTPTQNAPQRAVTSTSSGALNASSIAAQVDPGIVDVTSTLGGQGAIAAGTGMVITSSGEVLTNNHVIQGATSIDVLIAGTGPSYTAHVVGADAAHDVALLQIDGAAGLKTVQLGDSSTVAVGDPVIGLGNALGRQGPPSISHGRVTGLNQTITASDQGGGNAETLTGVIQIDAPIQPGDSGGPLVDASGKVIGMDTAANGGGFDGQAPSSVAFAVPINSAMSIVRQLEAGGGSAPSVPTGQRALLGVEVQDASSLGLSGALVAGVQAGSPAASAGITSGSVIVGIDGQPVDSASTLGSVISAHQPGDAVDVVWLDQFGQQHSATITLTAAPQA